MNAGFWVWLTNQPWRGWGERFARLGRGGFALLEISTPDASQLLRRISKMERDIFLPVKAAGIGMLLYAFYRGTWIRSAMDDLSIAVEWTRYFLWYYIAANLLIAGVLLALRRFPLGLVQWVVFFSGLLDAIFLSALTVLTAGYQSFLYWLFLALIIRSAVSVPRATSQLALHATIIACWVIAGIIHIKIATNLDEFFQAEDVFRRLPHHSQTPSDTASSSSVARMESPAASASTSNRHPSDVHENGAALPSSLPDRTNRPEAVANLPAMAPATGAARELETGTNRQPAPAPRSRALTTGAGETDETTHENPWQTGPLERQAEPALVRLALLMLMSVCAYGVQVLFERQRKAEEEAREFAMREGQLHAAGRLAAEFTHQMKNPLAIINNASYSLQRALKQGRTDVSEQILIIQEEVEHSDRIITQIMGYAQLSEGRVEKLDVIEELNYAVERIFPPAAGYPVIVHKDYAGQFPPLLMLRRHVTETFMNLLQNAREAIGDHGGNVWVKARCLSDYSIEVSIADDGPGIPPEKRERVFEAYYTTKEKGTGLGLATVKHNVELYGGSVKVESELGMGARFRLVFPAKTLLRIETKT